MILVLLLLFLSTIIFFPKKYQDVFFWLSCILVGFVLGIRWNSGTDFEVYYWNYQHVLSNDYAFFRRPDFLYYTISAPFSRLGVPLPVFFVFCSVSCWLLFGYVLKKYSKIPQLSLLVLYCSTIGLLGSNRQMFALALCFLAVFVSLRQKGVAISLVILAILFHFSAVIALPLLFLDRKFSKKLSISILIVFLILMLPAVELWLRHYFSSNQFPGNFILNHIKTYFEIIPFTNPPTSQVLFGIVRRLAIILPFYLLAGSRTREFVLLRNIAVASLVLYLVCVFNFTFLLGRLTIYYQMFDALSIALFATHFYQTRYRYHFFSLVGIFAIIIFFKSISPYPQLFIPYQTIFGTF